MAPLLTAYASIERRQYTAPTPSPPTTSDLLSPAYYQTLINTIVALSVLSAIFLITIGLIVMYTCLRRPSPQVLRTRPYKGDENILIEFPDPENDDEIKVPQRVPMVKPAEKKEPFPYPAVPEVAKTPSYGEAHSRPQYRSQPQYQQQMPGSWIDDGQQVPRRLGRSRRQPRSRRQERPEPGERFPSRRKTKSSYRSESRPVSNDEVAEPPRENSQLDGIAEDEVPEEKADNTSDIRREEPPPLVRRSAKLNLGQGSKPGSKLSAPSEAPEAPSAGRPRGTFSFPSIDTEPRTWPTSYSIGSPHGPDVGSPDHATIVSSLSASEPQPDRQRARDLYYPSNRAGSINEGDLQAPSEIGNFDGVSSHYSDRGRSSRGGVESQPVSPRMGRSGTQSSGSESSRRGRGSEQQNEGEEEVL